MIVTDAEILAARPAKNVVDPYRPYLYQVEPERTAAGNVEDVATIFLVNRETADGMITSARRLKLGSEKMLSTVQTLKTKAGESKSYEFYEKQ